MTQTGANGPSVLLLSIKTSSLLSYLSLSHVRSRLIESAAAEVLRNFNPLKDRGVNWLHFATQV